MHFRITALPAAPFQALFGASDETLAAHGAVRAVATAKPGFPCRVSLQDAEPGETLVLVNYTHQPAASPYRSAHAVFVREGAVQAHPDIDEVPALLRTRLLSVRAFNAAGMMVDADAVDGTMLEGSLRHLLCLPEVAYAHIHYAKPGCYAARAEQCEWK